MNESEKISRNIFCAMRGAQSLNFFLPAKTGITKIIRTIFFRKVWILVSVIASPKQPQSGTRLKIASNKVRQVKKIINPSSHHAENLIHRFSSKLMPTMNSTVQRKMVRYNPRGMAQGIPKT
jgi:hypothetical protein